MIKKLLGGLALGLFLVAGANAASVSLVVNGNQPAGTNMVLAGTSFTVDIVGTFEDGLLAGGLQLLYDAAHLELTGFSTDLNVDAALSCPGAALCPADPPGTASIVWGQFLVDLIPAGGTDVLMATLTFTANPASAGVTTGLSMIDFSAFTGGWFGAGFTPIATPDLVGADVAIVPLPAAAWLMIGGLGALAGFRRRS